MFPKWVRLPSGINDNFFKATHAATTPIGILVVGIVTRTALPQSAFIYLKGLWIFSESNVMNAIFADHGLLIFTVVYLLVFFARLVAHFAVPNPRPLLPTPASTRLEPKSQMWFLLGDMFVRYVLTLGTLVSLMIMKVKVMEADENFVISGHFLGITTLTITLLWEVRSSLSLCEVWDLDESHILTFKRQVAFVVVSMVTVLCFTAIVIWWCVLIVTATFYHSLRERIIGLLLGYVSPVAAYYVEPWIVTRSLELIN
ncbi:CYFA0S03e03180g1_1 [Cyberlindnera fabianii]|uniref:CYFA0S03e03180g1_1 n=1 Tax=Cyberlindnera fabianii TaxID=36022 RepID=A0A061AXJ7_CYBFA|nr:FIT family protein YFT2 [Cyberlindnera fabianii]CDR39427.1 CYFA0S03e03180g1_1 [Cyberlindnera fabianii]